MFPLRTVGSTKVNLFLMVYAFEIEIVDQHHARHSMKVDRRGWKPGRCQVIGRRFGRLTINRQLPPRATRPLKASRPSSKSQIPDTGSNVSTLPGCGRALFTVRALESKAARMTGRVCSRQAKDRLCSLPPELREAIALSGDQREFHLAADQANG